MSFRTSHKKNPMVSSLVNELALYLTGNSNVNFFEHRLCGSIVRNFVAFNYITNNVTSAINV